MQSIASKQGKQDGRIPPVAAVVSRCSERSIMLDRHRSLSVATTATFAVLFALCQLVLAWVPGAGSNIAPKPLIALRAAAEQSYEGNEDTIVIRRREVLRGLSSAALVAVAIDPGTASAKCTDIETCREIGDRKVDEDMKANPTTALPSGVRYKVLRPPTGRKADVQVKDGSTVDIVFSISANGAYMYSRGFGFEKIDVDGKKQSDLGLDSLRVKIGSERRDVPLGIEQAIAGMERGERRRIELPPNVGFETSEWRPEPVTRRGTASIASYIGRRTKPASISGWDVEVLRIKDT